MEKKRELWDLYDREGRRTGEIFERGFGTYENIPQGRFHLVSDILVRNKDGRYLLCKRHMGKDVYPGFWEASAGGSAKVGELPEECARRELKEETGLEADQLELINVVFREPSHSLIYCYVADVDADPDSVILQEGETVDYKWVDAAGLVDYSTSDVAIKTSVERYADFYNALKKVAAWRNSLNHSLLKSTQNTRTLLTGSYRYIRSDVPGSLTDDEVRWLYQNGITTIVDLRSEGEFLRKPCRLEHEEGFTYHHMPVTGDGAVPDSPEEVPESYVSMIDDQMERIIHTIMNADSNVLYFCNAGKDRTGVVSAIILYRLGFDDQTIIEDYMKTKENLMDILMAYVREHPEVDHFTVIPKEENITAVLAYLKSEHFHLSFPGRDMAERRG